MDDNSVVKAMGIRFIVMKVNIKQIHIKDAFYMSKLYVNLFSVSWNISNGLKVQFNLNECIVTSCNSEAVVIALREDILYKINFMKVHESDVAKLVQSPLEYDALKLWHRRLGHLSVKDVSYTTKHC